MTLTTEQRFSASSFAGFGSGRMASTSGGSFRKGFAVSGALGSGMGIGGGLGGGGGAQFGSWGVRSGGNVAFAAEGAGGGDALLCMAEEKMQMRSLNDRLAAYLEQVQMLEATNRKLEEKLRNLTFNKVAPQDLTKFDSQIKPLRQQLLDIIRAHTCISVEIDNARLASEDFKLRWETEVSMRQSLEGDIAGLRALQQDYQLANQAAMQDLQCLTDEYMMMKKNHQQDLSSVTGNLANNINVNVQAAESINLSQVLADIRAEYEAVVEQNRRQAEAWYMKQVEMKQAETAQITETVASGRQEMTEGRKHLLVLQMELEALLMGNENLKARLEEVETQYQQRLVGMSNLVCGLEGELTGVREGILQQSEEYQRLLDIKSRLEMEISTYKGLLEGAGVVGTGMVPLSRAGGSAGMVTQMKTTVRGGGVTMTASRGREAAPVLMKSSKTFTTSTSSGGAATMPSSGAERASVTSFSTSSSAVRSGGGVTTSSGSAITQPGTRSTVIKTEKIVTTISSSGDAGGDIRAASPDVSVMTSDTSTVVNKIVTSVISAADAPAPTSRVAVNTSATGVEMEAETATMPSAEDGGGVMEGSVTVTSSYTEFSSSGENVMTSGDATVAAEEMMEDGGAASSITDISLSSTGGEGVIVSSEGGIVAGGTVVIDEGVPVMSSGGESMTVQLNGTEFSTSISSGTVLMSGEGVSSGEVIMSSEGVMMSEGDMMVPGGEEESVSMPAQFSGSELVSDVGMSGGEMGEASVSVPGSGSEFASLSGDVMSSGGVSMSGQGIVSSEEGMMSGEVIMSDEGVVIMSSDGSVAVQPDSSELCSLPSGGAVMSDGGMMVSGGEA